MYPNVSVYVYTHIYVYVFANIYGHISCRVVNISKISRMISPPAYKFL